MCIYLQIAVGQLVEIVAPQPVVGVRSQNSLSVLAAHQAVDPDALPGVQHGAEDVTLEEVASNACNLIKDNDITFRWQSKNSGC